MNKIALALGSFVVAGSALATVYNTPLSLAQQVYSVSGPGAVFVANPLKQAQYNGTLDGDPAIYQFETTSTIVIDVQLAIPEQENSKNDISAALLDQKNIDTPLAVLESGSVAWDQPYQEPKTGITYRKGPAITKELPAGAYEIRIWSSNNDSAYAIAFGKAPTSTENLPPVEPPQGGPSILLLLVIAAAAALLGSYLARRRMRTKALNNEVKSTTD